MKKFIKIIKDKWLRKTSKTILLVALLLLIFIVLNNALALAKILPIDFTKEKIFSLSEESKEQISKVELNVEMYFFGYDEDSVEVILGRQYEELNDKIRINIINAEERPDLAAKYGVSSDTQLVAVSSNQRYKAIDASEMYTFDTTTYSTIDVTEQKLTNAILDVTISKKPQIYFLKGHGEYTIDDGAYINTLGKRIENDVNDVDSLDLLTSDMPEVCDALIIVNPTKDFTDIETQKIETYINNGGKIIWMQDPYIFNPDDPDGSKLVNVNKILSMYGISFSKGVVCEQSQDNMLVSNPELIIPELKYNSIIKDIYTDGSIVFFDTGKINTKSTEELESLGVTASPFVETTENAYYREISGSSIYTKMDTDEEGPFVLGEILTKKINDEKTSTLVAFSNALFATDLTFQLSTDSGYLTPLGVRNNADILLNTVAYLSNRDDAIRIRKDLGVVTYTATATQDKIVKIVIFGVPILIILTGIIVTIWRRKRR